MNALTRLFIRWSSEFAVLSFPTIDVQDYSSLKICVDVQKDPFLCLTVRLCRPICSVVRGFHFFVRMCTC